MAGTDKRPGSMEFRLNGIDGNGRYGLSLLRTNKTMGSGIEAGSLVGIYSYIKRFVSGLDTISYTVQRLSSLHDIKNELNCTRMIFRIPD